MLAHQSVISAGFRRKPWVIFLEPVHIALLYGTKVLLYSGNQTSKAPPSPTLSEPGELSPSVMQFSTIYGISFQDLSYGKYGRAKSPIFHSKFIQSFSIWLKIKSNIQETLKLQIWSDDDFKEPPPETRILQDWHLDLTPSLWALKPRPLFSDSPTTWSPPQPSFIKLNFDGASKGNPSQSGFGGVFQYHKGSILHIFTGYSGFNTNNRAKLLGLIQGLSIAADQGFIKLIIEGDSAIILSMCQKIIHSTSPSKVTVNWRLAACLDSLPSLLAQIPTTLISHVKRDANKVANRLANHGVQAPANRLNQPWPDHVNSSLLNDCRHLASQDYSLPAEMFSDGD